MAEPAKISVANQKGGVGKTTITLHVAGGLNQRGHDVLVVDADPQGSATNNLGYTRYFEDLSIDTTLADVLLDTDHLDDIEGTIVDVGEFDLARAHERMNEGLRSRLSNVTNPEKRLSEALSEVEDQYDYVLVDTPPSLDKISTNSLVYSQNLLVPTYPEKMSVGGLSILSDHVESLQEFYPVSYLGFVANRVQNSGTTDEVLDALEAQFGGNFPLWQIRDRVKLQRAISDSHGSIFTHDEEDEFALVFYDIAAWLDNKFGVESDVTLSDVFTDEEIWDAVVYGQIDPEDLAQISDQVATIASE